MSKLDNTFYLKNNDTDTVDKIKKVTNETDELDNQVNNKILNQKNGNSNINNQTNTNKLNNNLNTSKNIDIGSNSNTNNVNIQNYLINDINKNKEDNKDQKEENDEHFWYYDFMELFDVDKLTSFFPTNNMDLSEKLNSICRLFLYISIILFLYTDKGKYLLVFPIILLITYYVYFNKEKIIEKLSNEQKIRPSTIDNPMMNCNIISGSDMNNRAPILENNKVLKDKVKENLIHKLPINNKLFKSTFDLFNNNNSQRQFYTTPSTTIPNDQTAFAKWCYSTVPTCKEKNMYCAPTFNSLNNL